MKKSKFTEEQIAVALPQHEAGAPVREVTRKLRLRSRHSIVGRSRMGAWRPPRPAPRLASPFPARSLSS